MSETKHEIRQRKIKNGLRKQDQKIKDVMWAKLSTESSTTLWDELDLQVVKQRVIAKSHKMTSDWKVNTLTTQIVQDMQPTYEKD